MPASYKFVTHWQFQASPVDVWDAIHHSERWPQWWKAVESVVELQKGDSTGVGSLRRYTWRGALPYRLSFDMRTTQVEPPVRLEGRASGELEGRGCWTLSGQGSTTLVRYDWEVEANKRWMQILSPIARPLFEWNHDTVMRWGFEGLTARLAQRERVL
jgi:uncharacterized protein YndB with AHSA1/START domain